MSKKGVMPDFVTIDDYISSQPVSAQNVLKELRSLIKEAVPEAIEVPDYKVPSFVLIQEANTNLQIMMVAYAKFVSLYLFPATLEIQRRIKGL